MDAVDAPERLVADVLVHGRVRLVLELSARDLAQGQQLRDLGQNATVSVSGTGVTGAVVSGNGVGVAVGVGVGVGVGLASTSAASATASSRP